MRTVIGIVMCMPLLTHLLRFGVQISRDVLQRWPFPFTPDTNLLRLPPPSPFADSSTYMYSRGNVYRYISPGLHASQC